MDVTASKLISMFDHDSPEETDQAVEISQQLILYRFPHWMSCAVCHQRHGAQTHGKVEFNNTDSTMKNLATR